MHSLHCLIDLPASRDKDRGRFAAFGRFGVGKPRLRKATALAFETRGVFFDTSDEATSKNMIIIAKKNI